MFILRQGTTGLIVPLGPFLDETDGKTPETGLTINNTDIKLWKHGATSLVDKNSGGATHMAGGIYYATLDNIDTNTVGNMVIFVHVSGALPVRVECTVMAANYYDAIRGTDKLQVDTIEVSGTSQTARDLGANIDVTVSSRATPAQVNSEVDTALADINLDHLLLNAVPTDLSSAVHDDSVMGYLFMDTNYTYDRDFSALSVVGLGVDEIITRVTSFKFDKSVALNNFEFYMAQSTDHVSPATGLTVTAERSIDGGAFAACTNAVTEVGSGVYKINLSPFDMNGDVITLKFTAPGADQRTITIVTQA
jgi:hypothetical protein